MAANLDWYDRAILKFVLEWAPYSGPPSDEAFVRFGINTRAVLGRVDALLDAYNSNELHLEPSDFELMHRTMRYRRSKTSVASAGLKRISTRSRRLS